MKDYSQYGEQAVILDYFGTETGTFLSLGENDGETLSNVRALALNGWAGVMVEPAPTPYDRLFRLYAGFPDVMLVQAAICDHDGRVTLFDSGTHLNKGDTSLLSTTIQAEADKWKADTKFFGIDVPAMTPQSLIKNCEGAGFGPFDFISIDCEGQDMFILKNLDLTALGCRMLCIEYNGSGMPQFIAIALAHGLRLKHRNGVNLIFAK